MRCFIAIELDHDTRKPLARLLREKLPRVRGVRWCTEQQLHITLKFLGEVRDGQLGDVCEAAHAAAERVAPFQIRLGSLGGFPQGGNPRVLWCGIDDPAEGCAALVRAADPALRDLGFAAERRAYHAHITLGRSKSVAGSRLMRKILDDPPTIPAREMQVGRVVVFESRLSPNGAQYTALSSPRLGD